VLTVLFYILTCYHYISATNPAPSGAYVTLGQIKLSLGN